jgi:hypothetical protein
MKAAWILGAAAVLSAGSLPAVAASCDGQWSITLERMLIRGKHEDYVGTLTVANGRYTLKALANIYEMVSEGPIGADCKLAGARLGFTNRSDSYFLDLDLAANPAKGTWYDQSFREPVTAKK